jgi:hypothetical protein
VNFPDAVGAACLEFCAGRADLLAHALWTPGKGAPLRPLGKLFGEEAIGHGDLASALFRLGSSGTVFTSAVLRLGRPVWTAHIPRFGWHGLAGVLRNHGVKSGGAFPMFIDMRVAAVVELLSFEKLQADLASEALAEELSKQLEVRFGLAAAAAADDLERKLGRRPLLDLTQRLA